MQVLETLLVTSIMICDIEVSIIKGNVSKEIDMTCMALNATGVCDVVYR